MNYGYYAGNFCAVFKHLILKLLIELFKRKEKGFTRAGRTRRRWSLQPSPVLADILNLVRHLGLPDKEGS